MLRVWMVDDDDSYVLLAERALAGDPVLKGRVVFERFKDGDQALELLEMRAEQPSPDARLPDLILLDHRMPRMDGTDLLARIRSHPKLEDVPVCMMSTAADPSHISRCYALGASFCVSKPLKFEELVERLRAVCRFVVEVLELPAPDRLEADQKRTRRNPRPRKELAP